VDNCYFSAVDPTGLGLSQHSSKASSPLYLEPQIDPSCYSDVELPFEVWWHIHVLIHAGLLFQERSDEHFLGRVDSAVTHNGVDLAVAAVRELFLAGKPIQNPAKVLEHTSNALQASAQQSQTSPVSSPLAESNQVLVCRLVITPCGVYALLRIRAFQPRARKILPPLQGRAVCQGLFIATRTWAICARAHCRATSGCRGPSKRTSFPQARSSIGS
jgi:hypothetical protein